MSFPVPILLVAYNRYDTADKVFNVISKIRPDKFFFAVDGPKDSDEDRVKVGKVRDMINRIDWNCQLETFFPDNNLGLKVNVSSAINWFFEKVEAGIILEDDCLPNISFFHFCEELLEKYRNDSRVMHIGGNFFQNKRVGSGDYYFSQ
ncbi:MAG TPA: nucleotide-diphospho-sugar transferase, partial [candidate division Zixibacteria bacterium]|nr:nucleotide-diphospho-sugar transferase [candidate division Zixibacteria bacterium]